MYYVGLIAVGVGCYVASIFTWPALRQFWIGAEAEVQRLRDRARKVQAAMK